MLEEIPFFLPVSFFDFSIDIPYFKKGKMDSKYLLFSTSKYTSEKEFTKVYLGWNENFLYFNFDVREKIVDSFYPNFKKGDSLEIFLDTRNIKNHGYITKFCHHFVIFFKKIDGYYIKEITRFRNDDMHKIASSDSFKVSLKKEKKSCFLDLLIPSTCLYGYDVNRFNQIGFTYRINRFNGESQHFSVSSYECNIEREPGFWASLNLVK